MHPVILVHGGAGERRGTPRQHDYLRAALERGYARLIRGRSSIDAVIEAISILEDSGAFNAGTGSRLQLDGVCRMDASLMDGEKLRAGAVAAIENIRNPICAARLVMKKTPHVLVVGEGANRLARFYKMTTACNVRPQKEIKGLLKKGGKTIQLYKSIYRYETVGAVALDRSGRVAAGASTGGVAIMLPYRVGDSPLIGSGVYADNASGAVSLTGMGEGIIRTGLAKEVCCAMERGTLPDAALKMALRKILNIRGEAGAIVLSPDGDYTIQHTTPYMSAGVMAKGKPIIQDRFLRIA